jgi:hypothetical protein
MAPVPIPCTCGSRDPFAQSGVKSVQYVVLAADRDRIAKLETKIKLLERERDMWRNRCFAKCR